MKGKVVAAAGVVVVVVVLPVGVIACGAETWRSSETDLSRIMCVPGPSVLSQDVEFE